MRIAETKRKTLLSSRPSSHSNPNSGETTKFSAVSRLKVRGLEGTRVEFRKEKDHSIIRIKDCDENIHNRWNNQLSPVARVNEGDTVIFECRNGSDGQITDKSTSAYL